MAIDGERLRLPSSLAASACSNLSRPRFAFAGAEPPLPATERTSSASETENVVLSVLSPPLLDSAIIMTTPDVEPDGATEAAPEIDDAASESGSMARRADTLTYHATTHALPTHTPLLPRKWAKTGQPGPRTNLGPKKGAARAAATASSEEPTADNLSAMWP